jgi:cobalt/nickel transport system ATP-binding protein
VIIEIEDLAVVYPDGTKAIDGISLSVERGESVALIGANGAGKTSLLLALAGVLEAAEGVIKIEGVKLDAKTARRIGRSVGLVFQNPDDQLFMPRVCDDVAFGPLNFGFSKDEAKRLTDETLRRLGIAHIGERSPLKLSGGEKRIAAIATVLVMQPPVMLFDEPAAFLDPKAKRTLIDLMNGLSPVKCVATHDLSFASAVCDRVIMLKNGKVFADGSVELLEDAGLMEACGL